MKPLYVSYHKIGIHALSPWWVSTDNLRKHIQAFKEGGLDVTLTFDDGLENFYIQAYPVIFEYKISTIVFVISSLVGESDRSIYPPDEPLSRLMNWEMIKEVSDNGIIIGSHTQKHKVLTELSYGEICDELTLSKLVIEHQIHKPVLNLAYPHNAYDMRVIEAVKASKYEKAFAGEGAEDTQYCIRRVSMNDKTDIKKLIEEHK